MLGMANAKIVCVIIAILLKEGSFNEKCKSPQYLQLGEPGTVVCSYKNNSYGILWYNSTNYVTNTPVLFLKKGVKEGVGYETGEYDICKNGSMIINNVSLEHDHYFTVIKLNSLTDDYVPHYVRVVVTVIPEPPFPVVEPCDYSSTFCYALFHHRSNVTCFISNARPAVSLAWEEVTFNAKRNISMIQRTLHSGGMTTTIAVATDVFMDTHAFKLLVCNAEGERRLLTRNQTVLFVENPYKILPQKVITKGFKINSTIELVCGETNIESMVWKYKQHLVDKHVVIAYGSHVDGEFINFEKHGFRVNESGTLSITEANLEHEGNYSCNYQWGTAGGTTLYRISILEISGTTIGSFVQTEPRDGTSQRKQTLSIAAIAISSAVGSVATLILVFKVVMSNRRRRQGMKKNKPEAHPMLQPTSELTNPSEKEYTDMKEQFSKHLARKYENMCSSICPAPFLRSMKYFVNKVFVESGLQARDTEGNWKNVPSYNAIFSYSSRQSKRYFILGDAGYGKSTLCLQLAFDWYNSCEISPMKDKEFLILLRLRELGEIPDFGVAIKQLLLPKDTALSEDNIKYILQNSKRAAIILDGFDEYTEKNNPESFIMSIIKGDELQHFEVVVTSRPHPLLNDLPQATTLFRLIGFDDVAQNQCIKKTLANGDTILAENTSKALRENPYLAEFCRIPLLCGMFAHISKDPHHLLNICSLTSVFRYILSCLNAHAKIKYGNQYKNMTIIQTNYHILGKLSLDALCNETSTISWDKKELGNTIDPDFYAYCVQAGLLVEDDAMCISETETLIAEESEHKSVSFLHHLFCEWFAAHFLAQCIAKRGVEIDPRFEDPVTSHCNDENDNSVSKTTTSLRNKLNKLNISSFQYVFRFACGLNPSVDDKIFEYLKSRCGGDKMAILCNLERLGTAEEVMDKVKQFTASSVLIQNNQTELQKHCSIQLLKIASSFGVKIERVILSECFYTVDVGEKCLTLTLGIRFPRLDTLTMLVIREEGRILSAEDTCGILSYCECCSFLETLKFEFCLLPQRINLASTDLAKQRHKKVLWETDYTPLLRLRNLTGCWELKDNNRLLSPVEYENMEKKIQKCKAS